MVCHLSGVEFWYLRICSAWVGGAGVQGCRGAGWRPAVSLGEERGLLEDADPGLQQVVSRLAGGVWVGVQPVPNRLGLTLCLRLGWRFGGVGGET